MPNPFHIAIAVKELEACRIFYKEVLGCAEGRSDSHWVDLDFFGHQLVLHQQDIDIEERKTSAVDGKDVPIPHYGVVLDWDDWQILAERLKALNMAFAVEPYIRFEGEVGEQATMFFYDPEMNALEFKAFKNMDQLFAK